MTTPFDYDAELRRYHPRLWSALDPGPGDHVLDIGCGTGLTTRDAARAAAGALGVDVSATMVAQARRLSRREGLRNVRFEQADAQTHAFPAAHFSLGVSRFGTMFFTDPGAAFTNIARALRPGARLVQLVWQDRGHQEWDAAIRQGLAGGRARPAPAGGDPYSLADPAATRRVLTAAGFTGIQVTDVREPVYYGADTDAACDAALRLRMTQDLLADMDPARAEHALRRLRRIVAAHETAEGVWFGARAWLVTAHRA